MNSYVLTLGHWSWFVLAAVFLILELATPGAFMLWLGLAALVVGIISLVIDWSWQVQFVSFALIALALVPVWRRFASKVEHAPDSKLLNRRAEGYVGRVFTLDKALVDGVGNVRIDDTVWRVAGPDCAAGTRVRVARVEGAYLFVEPANG